MKSLKWDKIAKKIKEIRESRALNQTEFGERLGGIPQAVISKYERGTVKPRLEFLVEVAKFGKVSLNWLVLGDKSGKEPGGRKRK
jgi:transcriptional regulator with XRE-family HTH domain